MLTRRAFGGEVAVILREPAPKLPTHHSLLFRLGSLLILEKTLKMTTFTKRILTRKIGDENLDFHPPIHLQFFWDVPQEV